MVGGHFFASLKKSKRQNQYIVTQYIEIDFVQFFLATARMAGSAIAGDVFLCMTSFCVWHQQMTHSIADVFLCNTSFFVWHQQQKKVAPLSFIHSSSHKMQFAQLAKQLLPSRA